MKADVREGVNVEQLLSWSGGPASVLNPMFMDWYKSRHEAKFVRERGESFEAYVESVLRQFHPDFYNPAPKGSLGDGGADGLAEKGDICYACYGSRAQGDSEKALLAKLRADFERALGCWASFTRWRFVTNSPGGRLVGQYLIDVGNRHASNSSRPVEIRFWDCDSLWIEVISKLDVPQLNYVFPGVPGMVDIELSDMIPLLDALGHSDDSATENSGDSVAPVPFGKVEFNELPEQSRIELNVGRRYAPRIQNWYAQAADPTLHDQHATRFRQLYEAHRLSTDAPSEVLERLYVALAGDNFRARSRLANATYAVVAYFFDECHIFEAPPADYEVGG